MWKPGDRVQWVRWRPFHDAKPWYGYPQLAHTFGVVTGRYSSHGVTSVKWDTGHEFGVYDDDIGPAAPGYRYEAYTGPVRRTLYLERDDLKGNELIMAVFGNNAMLVDQTTPNITKGRRSVENKFELEDFVIFNTGVYFDPKQVAS